MSGLTKHTGPPQASPYPLQRISPTIDATLAKSETYITTISSALKIRLQMINDQIKHLERTAEMLIEEAQLNAQLHTIPCSIAKRPGQVYHVFRREDDSVFMSIISPQEWGDSFHLQHVGSYRLESDMSWKEISDATPVE